MDVSRLFRNLTRLFYIYPSKFLPRLKVQYTSGGKGDDPSCKNPKCPFKPNKGCCPDPCCPPKPRCCNPDPCCPNPYCPFPQSPTCCRQKQSCCPSDPCGPPKPPCPCPPDPCCPPKPPCPCPPKPPCPCPPRPPCCPPDPCRPSKPPCPCPPSQPCCPPNPCGPPKPSGPGPLKPPCSLPDPCRPSRPPCPKPEPFCPPKPPGKSKTCRSAPHISNPPRDLLNTANKSCAEARKILEAYKSPAPEKYTMDARPKFSEPDLSFKKRSKGESRSSKDAERKKKRKSSGSGASKSHKGPKKEYEKPNWTGVYNSIPDAVPVNKTKVCSGGLCSVCKRRSGTCLCSCPECNKSTYRCICRPEQVMSAEETGGSKKLETNKSKTEDGVCPVCQKKPGRCFCQQGVDKKSNMDKVKSKTHLGEPSSSNSVVLISAKKSGMSSQSLIVSSHKEPPLPNVATLSSANISGTSYQPLTVSSGTRPPVSNSASLISAKITSTSCQPSTIASCNDLPPSPRAAEPIYTMPHVCAPPPCYQRPQPQFALPPCRIPQPSCQLAPSCKKPDWANAAQTATSSGRILSPPCCKTPEAPSSSKQFEPSGLGLPSRKKSKAAGLGLASRKRTKRATTPAPSRKKSKPSCNVRLTRKMAKPSSAAQASRKKSKPVVTVKPSSKQTQSLSAAELSRKRSQPIFFPAGNYKISERAKPNPSLAPAVLKKLQVVPSVPSDKKSEPPPLCKKFELEPRSSKSESATKPSNKLFPLTVKKILTLRSLFFKTSTPPKQKPPPTTRSFCNKTSAGRSGKPSDTLPKKDSCKKIASSRSPPLSAAEPIYKKPCPVSAPSCGKQAGQPCDLKQPISPSPAPPCGKQREPPCPALAKSSRNDSADSKGLGEEKRGQPSSAAPLCKESAIPMKTVFVCSSPQPPRSCKSAPCTDGRSIPDKQSKKNRAEDDDDPCGNCQSYTPRIPEQDLLCRHPHVFRPPTPAEEKALRLYFGDCYQNKEYHMYGKNTYLDLQMQMMKYRQPQPNSRKPVRRSPSSECKPCK